MNTELPPANRPQANQYRRMLESLLQSQTSSDLVREDCPSAESASFAMMWALLLGRCRLFGVTLDGDLNRGLPADVAAQATAGMIQVVQDVIVETQHMPQRWDVSQTQLEFDTLVGDLLHVRMDAWSVLVAVYEAERTETKLPAVQSQELNRKVSSLVDAIEAFDHTLNRYIELLSIVVDTRLLDNWRALLCEEYSLALPWWLDGTLERIAAMPLERSDLSNLRTHDVTPVELASQRELAAFGKRREPAAALAANDKERLPEYDESFWKPSTSDSQCRARLRIPMKLSPSGQTKVDLFFEGVQEQELVGKAVALGNGRAIVRKQHFERLPESPDVKATFIYEELGLPARNLQLRVNNEVWTLASELDE